MGDQDVLGKVLSLHIYPIKGCKPVTLSTAVTTPRGTVSHEPPQLGRASMTGFPYDRHWVIVEEATNKTITQRTVPKMATVETELPAEVALGGHPPPDAALTIRLPFDRGTQSFRIPLTKSDQPIKEIHVRSWTGRAADEGDEAAEKLTAFFGEPMRLYRFLDATSIEVDPVFVSGFERAFSDGFPYLVVNTKSYQHLRSASDEPFDIDRFRANIVIEAQNAWEEDEWRQVQICSPDGIDKGPVFELVKPCKRCKVTTVNQSTGVMGIQALKILKELRNGVNTGFAVYLPQTKQQGFFGWDAVSHGEKCISVDDRVCLLQQGVWSIKRSWYQYAKEKMAWLWN